MWNRKGLNFFILLSRVRSRMLFQSVLTTAIIGLSLCVDDVFASNHGRFGQKAREYYDRAKRASSHATHQAHHQHNFRFLNHHTKRKTPLNRVYHLSSAKTNTLTLKTTSSIICPRLILMWARCTPAWFQLTSTTSPGPFSLCSSLRLANPSMRLPSGSMVARAAALLKASSRRMADSSGSQEPLPRSRTHTHGQTSLICYGKADCSFGFQILWLALLTRTRVDQPVGTGLSIGTPTAVSQEETAAEFIKFFKNFQETFGIKNFKIYVTGESYAGRYVPYISAAMLDEKDKEYYDLKGTLIGLEGA